MCVPACLRVQGDLVLRDGQLITDNDVHMRASGIYVPSTGGLHVALEPVLPVVVDITDQDRATQSSGLR